MAEAIAVAKEIGRMAGGIGMLEAQRTSEEKERKIRSFHEIAVLYRTHRQGELLETCLRKEGIPYVVSGRESFLKDETLRRSAAFFRYLLDPEQTAAKEEGSLLFADGEGNPLGSLLFEETAQVWKKKIQEQSPAELLKEWIREMGMETNKAMEKLSRMAVCYETIEELLTMLELGVESDLKRSDTDDPPRLQRPGISGSDSIWSRTGKNSSGKRILRDGFRRRTTAPLCRNDKSQRRTDPHIRRRRKPVSEITLR